MHQGVSLLARKDKAALFGACQRRLPVGVVHFMAFPVRHEFAGMVQAPFGLDQSAGGEAVFTPPVLAEFDQIGRAPHRAHNRVELIDPVAVAVRELRHVAAREGRLLMRDRVQPQIGIRDDSLAIAACNLAVHLRAVGLDRLALDAPILNAMRGRADLALRFQRDALCLQAAMVDACVNVEFGQALIGELRPAFAPALHHFSAVPVPHLWPKPFSSTVRMVSMTWAWGLGMPSSATSQWTLRSAIMPRSTNSPRTKSRASSMPSRSVISRGMANSTSRASWASLRTSNASTSFQSRSRSFHTAGAFSGSSTSEWTTPRFPEKSWLRSSRSSRSREPER